MKIGIEKNLSPINFVFFGTRKNRNRNLLIARARSRPIGDRKNFARNQGEIYDGVNRFTSNSPIQDIAKRKIYILLTAPEIGFTTQKLSETHRSNKSPEIVSRSHPKCTSKLIHLQSSCRRCFIQRPRLASLKLRANAPRPRSPSILYILSSRYFPAIDHVNIVDKYRTYRKLQGAYFLYYVVESSCDRREIFNILPSIAGGIDKEDQFTKHFLFFLFFFFFFERRDFFFRLLLETNFLELTQRATWFNSALGNNFCIIYRQFIYEITSKVPLRIK